MLTDAEIKKGITAGAIGYSPFDERYLNPASIDMTLSAAHRIPSQPDPGNAIRWLDVAKIEPGHTRPVVALDTIVMMPGDFILASTNETVSIPDNMVARVEGKSSLGRIGLAVHITAGFVDPGFSGPITLEIANLSPFCIVLRPSMRIAQLAFIPLGRCVETPYGVHGHYQGQEGPTESRYEMRD